MVGSWKSAFQAAAVRSFVIGSLVLKFSSARSGIAKKVPNATSSSQRSTRHTTRRTCAGHDNHFEVRLSSQAYSAITMATTTTISRARA